MEVWAGYCVRDLDRGEEVKEEEGKSATLDYFLPNTNDTLGGLGELNS